MIYKRLLSSLLGLSFIALGCGNPTQSGLQGHYEDANPSGMSVYRGQQVVPPEYARTESVIVSSTLFTSYGREDLLKAILDAGAKRVWVTVSRGSGESINSSTFSDLRLLLGSNINKVSLLEQKDAGGITVWARDWSPLGALSREGKLRLLDLNYYPSRGADDATSRTFAGIAGVERVSVPVYNEGGNFMSNGRGECLMTTRVTDANSDVFKSGDLVLNAEDVKQYYDDFAGCQNLSILPRMPTEKTGHIDMWGKFLDDDTIIVGQISDETLALANSSNRTMAGQIQTFLNERAKQIQQLGYNVVRIPMPLPSPSLYRSYTNSLLVNGVAIIPQYKGSIGGNYLDQKLLSAYEAKVRQIYESLGYRVTFIPSDQMIATGGAVHCVTMQVPAVL